jgi:gluconate kinase
MPPALLDSQFATLEEPGPDENPIIVEVGGTPEQIVQTLMERLE